MTPSRLEPLLGILLGGLSASACLSRQNGCTLVVACHQKQAARYHGHLKLCLRCEVHSLSMPMVHMPFSWTGPSIKQEMHAMLQATAPTCPKQPCRCMRAGLCLQCQSAASGCSLTWARPTSCPACRAGWASTWPSPERALRVRHRPTQQARLLC